MIPYDKLTIGMEVEALSPTHVGGRWVPARVIGKHTLLQLAEVRMQSHPSGDYIQIHRSLCQLRLKPERGGG